MSQQESQPTIVEQAYKDSSQQKQALDKDKQALKLLQQLKKEEQQRNKLAQTQLKVSTRIQLDQDTFFKVMDLMDEYDKLLKQINDEYSQGMMLIANVKFINPYTSLSIKGYKPTPVVTKIKINDQQKSQQHPNLDLFSLVSETKNIKFTNSVIDSINKEIQRNQNDFNQNENEDQNEQDFDADSQSAHSSMSTANQIYTYEEQELIIEEQEVVDECRKYTESDNFSLQDFIIDRFSIESQKGMVSQTSIKFYSLLKKLLHLAQKKIQINKKFDLIQKDLKLSIPNK